MLIWGWVGGGGSFEVEGIIAAMALPSRTIRSHRMIEAKSAAAMLESRVFSRMC